MPVHKGCKQGAPEGPPVVLTPGLVRGWRSSQRRLPPRPLRRPSRAERRWVLPVRPTGPWKRPPALAVRPMGRGPRRCWATRGFSGRRWRRRRPSRCSRVGKEDRLPPAPRLGERPRVPAPARLLGQQEAPRERRQGAPVGLQGLDVGGDSSSAEALVPLLCSAPCVRSQSPSTPQTLRSSWPCSATTQECVVAAEDRSRHPGAATTSPARARTC